MPQAFSQTGFAAGDAERYSGLDYKEESSWVYDGHQTRVINPQDAEHTSTDGRRISGSSFINAGGQVLGFAQRFGSGGDAGQSVWFYNGSGTTSVIGLTDSAHTTASRRRFNTPIALTDSGAAIGIADQRATRGRRGTRAIGLALQKRRHPGRRLVR
jgi:hypothetical protein